MSDHILVSTNDGIAEIRLNRPDKYNAITLAMYQAMADALVASDEDPAVRAVLIVANGETFSAGNDLNDFVANPPAGDDAPVFRFLRAISTARKVVVAAVQGSAVGVGTTMLLHCDLVIAAQSAKLQVPFVSLGLVPEAASTLLLPRLIGYQRAAEFVLLGEPINAETAHRYGMVNRVVADPQLYDTTRSLALAVAARPPEAVRQTKALLRSAPNTVAERIAQEGAVFRARLGSPELKEAVAAFFEKRAPNFANLPM